MKKISEVSKVKKSFLPCYSHTLRWENYYYEEEKIKIRAARFGIPLVEPKKAVVKQAPPKVVLVRAAVPVPASNGKSAEVRFSFRLRLLNDG